MIERNCIVEDLERMFLGLGFAGGRCLSRMVLSTGPFAGLGLPTYT